MNKFEEFDAAHKEAVNKIKEYLKPSKNEPSMHKLVDWMMNTDANPCAYLAEDWGLALSSAESFSGLLTVLHNALYDDGDISFVEVNGQPRIVFAHPTDKNFRERVLSQQEQYMETDERWSNLSYEIKVLNIKPEEFGLLYDEYQTQDMKRCFIYDAEDHGVEWAVKHYKKYKCWDESWIKELTTSP